LLASFLCSQVVAISSSFSTFVLQLQHEQQQPQLAAARAREKGHRKQATSYEVLNSRTSEGRRSEHLQSLFYYQL